MKIVDKAQFFKAIDYEPHPGQIKFHNSPSRFRVACCGRRFGKSTMAARDLEPQLLTPNKRFWIVGPTYDLGEKEFRVIWDDLIIGRGLGKDRRIKKGYSRRTGEMYIEFPWQTRVEVRSAQHPENLVGESLDGAIMSEAAKQNYETWERFIRPSLADKRGWATFPTTPEGHNWLYELWLLGLDESMVDFASWRFPSWENRVVFPGGRQDPEILLIEKSTTTEWFMQEIGADFASFVGKIYGEFDETKHVKNIQYNPAWPNYIAFDWGYINPLAAIEFQVSPQDDVYIWREHYKPYVRLNDHFKELSAREQPEGYQITMCFGDAADPEAVMSCNIDFAPCIGLPEAKKNWREGIDLVKTFLRLEEIGEADEFGTPLTQPKLFVDPSCHNTIREFQSYRAPDARNGVMPHREQAAKQDDHAVDAIRYGLMHIFKFGAAGTLSDAYVPGNYNSSGDAGFFTTGVTF